MRIRIAPTNPDRDSEDRRVYLNQLQEKAILGNRKNKKILKLLLANGGHFVQIFPDDGDEIIAKICDRGYLRDGSEVTFKKAQANQCHLNSAKLWSKSKNKHFIVTGFALSEDSDGIQLWRQHTWIETVDGRIIESTESRSYYFGFKLNKREAEKFTRLELLTDID
jgi:hypothetical protein